MRGLRGLVGGIALAVATSAAAAPTVTVDWNTNVFEPNGIGIGTVVHPGTDVATSAGRFAGEVNATSEFDESQLFESMDDFFASCHDLTQYLVKAPTVYGVTYGASPTMLAWLGAVNSVLGNGDYSWIDPQTSTIAAAIQLGIWEALHYGPADTQFVLDTGLVSVSLSKVPDTVEAQFATFRSQMLDPGNVALSPELVMVLTSTASQDVITGRLRPAELVPEPSTLLLLSLAIAAAMLSRRRVR
jgi:hypothetical protein